MRTRRLENLVLIAALLLALLFAALFAADLYLSQKRRIADAEARLQHFSTLLSEHTAHAFEAVDGLLRDIAADISLRRRDWREWDSLRGWEYLAQRQSRALPQLRSFGLFDEKGDQRFISTTQQAAPINISDRPHFLALRQGAEASAFGPYVSRNTGRYAYGIARPLRAEGGAFGGLVVANIEPAYFPDFCWGSQLSEDIEGVLINRQGIIVAACRPSDMTPQGTVIGSPASEVLLDGALRGVSLTVGQRRANGLLVAVTPVAGYADLYVLAAQREAHVLAPWEGRLLRFGLLGGTLIALLVGGALALRRHLIELRSRAIRLAARGRRLALQVDAATAEIERQKAEAERANAAKSRFLAAASHDLRQPLHALALFAADLQRLARNGANEADLKRIAEQVGVSTSVLGELLDSLLDVSRLDVSGVKADIQPFAIQTVFSRLETTYQRAAQGRRLTLRFRPTRFHARSDPALIERLLTNLVANAIRYTPEGRRVLVAARRQGNHIRIEVRDSGIGIPREHQAAIFKEFFQVGNAAREPNKGLGLGLSIVDRLGKALGVPVAVRSQPGVGSVFSILLEACEAPPTLPAPAPRRAERRQLVLFVGANPDIAIAARLAGDWGFQAAHLPDAASYDPEVDDAPAIAVVAEDEFAAMRGHLGPDCSLVIIHKNGSAPAGAYALTLPIRPAKLRALLGQIQKTESKLMP